MRRTLAILSFIAGISLTPLPVCAQGIEASQQQFVEAFLNVRKGEEQEKAGDLKAAIVTYRSALGTLMRIKQENPKWNTDLVDFRIKRTMEAVDHVQEKLGGSAMKPGGNPPDVLPPLNLGDVQPDPPAPAPAHKAPKGAPVIDDSNPIAAVQRQMEDYKRQLSEVREMLHAEKERNSKLTTDIADAMDARKKAEDARTKAQQLAQVFEASIHELKTKGDENSTRAKDLEAKLAVANRAKLDTQAELAAVEERVSQLLGRTRVLSGIAKEAGTMPAQVKALQAKLEAEQKATTQQSEQAKKREADLKGQIAALAKDKADSAGSVAEMKSLQAKLDAEQKTSASDALKAKKREEDLKGQLASLTKERNDAKEELVRLRELNKQTDKLMADNSSLLKKLGEAEKQILTFKSGGSRDTDLAALRKQIIDTQKALTTSDQRNSTLQSEIGELQKKVTEYSKQISQFKADKTASAEERKKMEDENHLLQGIVTRVLQEDANRALRKKMIQGEVSKLHIQSDALLQQISYLSQPVVKLSASERKLFKKPIIEVQSENMLVAVKTDSAPPAGESPAPATISEPAAPGAGTPESTPAPKSPEPPATTPPEAEKPPVDTVKPDSPPSTAKPKSGDDLPEKDTTEPKTPDKSATPTVASATGAKLPAAVKPIADQAKKAFDGEKFAEAEKLYDKTLQIAPNNVYLLSNRAVVQYRMGKFKQSEETFKKALAIAPEDAFCWSTIGIVYYQEEKFDEAVNALTKSLAINPRNPTAHNYLGITAAQKGWQEAAQKELESAVQLDPKYGDAWYNLAITLATKQPPDKAEARKAYEKALELGIPKEQTMEDLLNK